MADETTRAIDRLFDMVDSSVEVVDHAFNRSKRTLDQLEKHSRRRVVIDTEATAASPKERNRETATRAPRTARTARAQRPSVAVAKKPQFYIVEAVGPSSGATLFVVTDGGKARAECTTRELAGQILRALEKA